MKKTQPQKCSSIMQQNKILKNIISIKNALFYSLNGLKYLLKERAFKQELLCGVVLGFIELFRNTSSLMRIYLFSSFILILLAEALNSAIETVVNRISLENHELSKKAKDIGSAAVFITMLHFTVVWLVSFLTAIFP